MGKLSRTKGAAYERELAKLIADAMPGAHVRRGLQAQGAASAKIADVECPEFWVEAKRGKKPNMRAALRQAEADTDGRWPVAVVRDDRDRATVTMRLDDWLVLVAEWWRDREEVEYRLPLDNRGDCP